jgi:exopolysaccharide biosynthesis polyprenyl glycosylphosphotransferase
MLRVLQHYLPIRTALLVLSETLILGTVLSVGLSQHLSLALSGVRTQGVGVASQELARLGLTAQDALVRCIISAFLLTLLSQVAIGFNQLYDFHVSSSRYERASRFVESAGTALALSVGITFLTHFWGLERVLDFPGLTVSQRVQTLIVSIVVGFGILYLWRNVYHWAMRRANLNQRVLILGSRGPAHSLARQILDHPDAGYEVAGLVPEPEPRVPHRRANDEPDDSDATEPDSGPRHNGRPKVVDADHEATPATEALLLEKVTLLEPKIENRGVAMASGAPGSGDSFLSLARGLGVDLLVVALENRRQMLPTEDLLRCRLGGIDVREREDLYEQITGKIAIAAMRPSYLIFNEGFRRHPWAALMKRTIDIVFALMIFLVTWPLMILAALAVRMDSPGTCLFRQERVGQDGKPFTLLKFRSMRADAEKESGPVWSSEDDPRITRSGRFMRKTRIDELPQLFNVLSGAMSLVGPRPERQHFIDDLAEQIPYFHQRHIVKPGLTGWAQINYPYGNTAEDALHKLQYDMFYIKNQSLLFDLSIIFNTIKTVVLRQGT